jgi:CDP-diacylglycerol--glycerol-3-phosphate 3-phosphatidyltransferase
MLLSHPQEPLWRLATTAVFVGAILTDSLDGYLARKHNIDPVRQARRPHRGQGVDWHGPDRPSIIGELSWWVTVTILVREWASPS